MINEGQVKVNGRILNTEDVDHIKEMVRLYPGLSRQELISTICVNSNWGSIIYTKKQKGLEEFLLKLEEDGQIRLPLNRTKIAGNYCKGYGHWGRGRNYEVSVTDRTDPQDELAGVINDYTVRELELTSGMEKEQLWNEYIERYHELRYGRPFGDRLKYFIKIDNGMARYAGCLMFSASAWSLARRDSWIGWSKEDRTFRLNLVVNNTRFLVFPWIKVKNLASWALAEAVRSIAGDWQRIYRYTPVLLETFVDGGKHTGACYRASNWVYLGDTKGHGRQGSYGKYLSSPKHIYMYPLVEDFREYLTGKKAGGDKD